MASLPSGHSTVRAFAHLPSFCRSALDSNLSAHLNVALLNLIKQNYNHFCPINYNNVLGSPGLGSFLQ